MSAPLTDGEKTLAVMLDAWVRWGGLPADVADPAGLVVVGVGNVLADAGYLRAELLDVDLTDAGRDLIDRARKAGVL